jgi:hypothetical protein
VSTTAIPDRFTTLLDEHALQATVVALEEHGFSVEVVGDLDAARRAVPARIPDGWPVMTSTSSASRPACQTAGPARSARRQEVARDCQRDAGRP